MELRQESLFADETKGGIEVIYSKFIDQRRMDYKALFGGFDHLRVITFSYGLGFVDVAFFATGCSFLDIAEVVDRSVAQVSKEIYDTWCEDYYIGCVDNIAKLAFDGYLVREQGLDEDGVEPGEVIVLEEYMEGVPQESRGLGTFDVHGV